MSEDIGSFVEEEVKKFYKLNDVDDTVEHSFYSISHPGFRYGTDFLKYQAERLSRDSFVVWLEGVLVVFGKDLRDPYSDLEDYELKYWKLYYDFLNDLLGKCKKKEDGDEMENKVIKCQECGKWCSMKEINVGQLCSECKVRRIKNGDE